MFDLLHCDTRGPHKIPTYSCLHFFLIVVDDFTQCTLVFLMQLKSKVQHLSMSFVKFVQTQFHTIIRSDTKTEFLSLQPFFTSCDIELQRTCVYTPQKNGVVEHKHRHILNVAWFLLFQSPVSLNFWGECILITVYLINRTPSPLLSN